MNLSQMIFYLLIMGLLLSECIGADITPLNVSGLPAKCKLSESQIITLSNDDIARFILKADSFAEANISPDNIENAISYYDIALAIDPNNTTSLYKKGIFLDSIGRYDEAVHYLGMISEITPCNPSIWFRIGLALSNQSNYSYAKICFKNYASLLPNLPEPWLNTGLALTKIGQTDEAIECYDKCIGLCEGEMDRNSTCAICWYSKGLALYKRGNYKGAYSAFKNAIISDPGHIDARY